MGTGGWLGGDLIGIVGAVCGIVSLCFTAIALRSETKSRRDANLLAITANHRELWKTYLTEKSLARVRDPHADTKHQPVTDREHIFVISVILHMNSVFYLVRDRLVVTMEGMSRDVAQILSRPIASEVWEKIKQFQNEDFVVFVESCRKGH